MFFTQVSVITVVTNFAIPCVWVGLWYFGFLDGRCYLSSRLEDPVVFVFVRLDLVRLVYFIVTSEPRGLVKVIDLPMVDAEGIHVEL